MMVDSDNEELCQGQREQDFSLSKRRVTNMEGEKQLDDSVMLNGIQSFQ